MTSIFSIRCVDSVVKEAPYTVLGMKRLLHAFSGLLTERTTDRAANIHEDLLANGDKEVGILNSRLRALDAPRH
jgi:hypothetical protein